MSEAGRQGDCTDRVITLRVARGTTVRERATEPIIDLLDRQLDALLGEAGSTRSLVRIVDDEQRPTYRSRRRRPRICRDRKICEDLGAR